MSVYSKLIDYEHFLTTKFSSLYYRNTPNYTFVRVYNNSHYSLVHTLFFCSFAIDNEHFFRKIWAWGSTATIGPPGTFSDAFTNKFVPSLTLTHN